MEDKRQLDLAFSPTDWVSVSWAARAIGISHTTVYRLLMEDRLYGRQLTNNGWWRIRKDSVISFLAKINEDPGFAATFERTERPKKKRTKISVKNSR